MLQYVDKRDFSLIFSPTGCLTFDTSLYLCFAVYEIRGLDQFTVYPTFFPLRYTWWVVFHEQHTHSHTADCDYRLEEQWSRLHISGVNSTSTLLSPTHLSGHLLWSLPWASDPKVIHTPTKQTSEWMRQTWYRTIKTCGDYVTRRA